MRVINMIDMRLIELGIYRDIPFKVNGRVYEVDQYNEIRQKLDLMDGNTVWALKGDARNYLWRKEFEELKND